MFTGVYFRVYISGHVAVARLPQLGAPVALVCAHVVAAFLLRPDSPILPVVDQPPAPRARVAQADDPAAVLVRRPAVRVRLLEPLDARGDDLYRNRGSARDGLRRHVHDPVRPGEDD